MEFIITVCGFNDTLLSIKYLFMYMSIMAKIIITVCGF